MLTSRKIAARLLGAQHSRMKPAGDAPKLFPFALAIANLFFIAYFEQHLRDGESARMLPVFLFLESSIFLAVTTALYVGSTSAILEKTKVYALTPWSRFLFVMGSALRDRAVLLLWGSTVIGLLILYHRPLPALILSPILYTAFLLSLLALMSVLFLVFTRLSRPVGAVVWIAGFAIGIVLVGSLLFKFTSLLDAIVLLAWASSGVASAASGDATGAMLDLFRILGVLSVTVVAARRFG